MTQDARLEHRLEVAERELLEQREHRKELEARIARQRIANRGKHDALDRYRSALLRAARVVEEVDSSDEPRSYMSAYLELRSIVAEFYFYQL